MAKNKEKLKKFWLSLWNLIKPYRKQIKIITVLIFLVESTNLVGPYFLKIIIDKLISFDNKEIKLIIGLIVLMFLVNRLSALFQWFRDRRLFQLNFDLESYLQIKAQEKLMYLSLNYHERENTGNKISKIERGVAQILNVVMNLAWEVVPTILQLVVTFLVLIVVDWRFAVVYIVFAPAFIYLTVYTNKILYPLRQRRHIYYEEASGKVVEGIININAVKSFVQEKREIKEFKKIRDKIKKIGIKELFKLINYSYGRGTILGLGRACMLLLAVYFVWQGQITLGTLVFVITLSEKAFASLWRLSRFYDRVAEGAVAVTRLTELLDQESEVKNIKNGFFPKKITGQIKFKNVDFAYSNKNEKALKKVNLIINSDSVTALIGPSGGGKTTVARMIYRHYDPQVGDVLLDDVNLRDYDLYAMRRFISIVPQEVEIFNASVNNNINYANPKASEREVIAAARIANAEEFILKLPNKYKTEVGERGIKLSGGQRQRIGIARAILANPRILIFDEATSNLDSMSEKLIQEAMDKITRNRTVIIIAHRLSTIKKADKIIVLENGLVVEQGSHFELSKTDGGLYAKLLNLQKMGDVS